MIKLQFLITMVKSLKLAFHHHASCSGSFMNFLCLTHFTLLHVSCSDSFMISIFGWSAWDYLLTPLLFIKVIRWSLMLLFPLWLDFLHVYLIGLLHILLFLGWSAWGFSLTSSLFLFNFLCIFPLLTSTFFNAFL